LEYPLLLIMIKEAAPSPSHLGKINGLAASTGGACRTVASPVAGILYGIGSQMHFTALAWWASAIIAILGALQVPWIDRQKNKTAHVRSAAAWAQGEAEQQPQLEQEREQREQQRKKEDWTVSVQEYLQDEESVEEQQEEEV